MRPPWPLCVRATTGRARALLAEVAAAGDSLDESLRAKVDKLLQKLSDEKGKQDPSRAQRRRQDAEALAAQRLNAEVGHQDRRRAVACTTPIPTRRSRLYETDHPGGARPRGFRPT